MSTSASICAFYFMGNPIEQLTSQQKSEMRNSIAKHFGPLDNLLRIYPIETAKNVRELRMVLNEFEVDVGTPLTSGNLIDLGLKYSSIILYIYGKWLNDTHGIITGADCRDVCRYGNINMLKFITMDYLKFVRKFKCVLPTDELYQTWAVQPNSAEFWMHCCTSARDAGYYTWSHTMYTRMLKCNDIDVNYLSHIYEFCDVCDKGTLDDIKVLYGKYKNELNRCDIAYALSIVRNNKQKNKYEYLNTLM